MKSKAIRDSAKGDACTINAVGICNYDPATTILAHLPDDSGTVKISGKSDDVGCAFYACSACHLWLDGARLPDGSEDDYCEANNHRYWYSLRALKRTIRRMVEKGLVVIK